MTHRLTVERVRAGLDRIPADALDPPETGRVGATLVLLRPTGDHLEITYTRRQPHLSSHPGQISFPGGRVDPGESIIAAALREAQEEIGLDTDGVTVLGRLPAFYIPPSRFWMSAVVALWDDPHPLRPNPDEVAEIMTVSTETLRQPDRWRAVPLSAEGATWAWQLAPQRLLWGATAVVTGVLLHVVDPDWSDGVLPSDLDDDRHVRPWEDPESAGLTPSSSLARSRLRGLTMEQMSLRPDDAPSPDLEQVARDVVTAVRQLGHRPAGPVVVLVGPGRTGQVGRAVAELLTQEEVTPPQIVEAHAAAGLDGVMQRVAGAGVIVDAMLGRGFHRPLREPVRGLVRALSATGAPLIAVDLPSGIDPTDGMVGDTVSADVTVALAPFVRGHSAPGALPFLGDLYVSRPGRDLVRVDAVDRPSAWAE